MGKGSISEGEREEEAPTEREAELGRPRARGGKVFPSESFSRSTTPVLAMFRIYVLQLCLGSEGLRGTPLPLLW